MTGEIYVNPSETPTLPLNSTAAFGNTQSSGSSNLAILSNMAPPAAPTIGKFVKFSLPAFSTDDPETWFAAAHHIFSSNAVQTEDEKFSYLLQCLGPLELSHIKDIIISAGQNKYTSTKERLIRIHGTSKQEKIRKILSGTDINPNEKPSVSLAKLKGALGPDMAAGDGDLLSSIWLQKLPARTREFLTLYTDETLEKQAEIADKLFETYEKSVGFQVAAVSAPSGPAIQSNQMEVLIALLQNLTTQVAAIKLEQSSDRGRSHQRRSSPGTTPHRGRSRSRRRTEIIDGKCWYHHKYPDSARGCAPGCSFFQSGNRA